MRPCGALLEVYALVTDGEGEEERLRADVRQHRVPPGENGVS